MECAKVQNLLSEYSVGLIEGKQQVDIEEHIAACPECAAELEKIRKVMLLVDDLSEKEPPTGLWNGVYNRIAEPQEKRRKVGGLFGRRMGLSAGLAAAALAGIMMLSRVNSPTPVPVYAESEYVQGHAVYAVHDALADQVALNSVAALADRDQSGDGRL